MSGNDYYDQPQDGNSHHFSSNNPFQQVNEEQNAWAEQPSSSPYQHQQSQYSAPQGYAPPSGPPPAQYQQGYQSSPPQSQYQPSYQSDPPSGQAQYAPGQVPGHPPDEFKEEDFVPQSERGEQREAMEQFEMTKGTESQEDRDVATLQQEFPGVDGSLIAALYGDSKSLSGTREMLVELAGQQDQNAGSLI